MWLAVRQERSLPWVRQGRRETTEAPHREPGSSDTVRIPRTLGVVPDEDASRGKVPDGRQRARDPGSTVDADDVELPTYLRQRVDVPRKVEFILAGAAGPHLGISRRRRPDLDQIDRVHDVRLDQHAAHDVREGVIVFDAVYLGASSP